MKSIVKGACLLALMVPVVGMAADEAPKSASCYEIRYSLDFLDRYPTAPAICEEVVERNGVKYARMDATVKTVSSSALTIGFKNVFGTEVADLEIQPVKDSTLMLDGKKVKWSDVKRGDMLSFWLPERSLHFVTQPGSDDAPIVFKSK